MRIIRSLLASIHFSDHTSHVLSEGIGGNVR
jgi:hypothetical protein